MNSYFENDSLETIKPGIDAECVAQLHDHFQTLFNGLPCHALVGIRDAIAEGTFASDEQQELLKKLNMTLEQTIRVRDYLRSRYFPVNANMEKLMNHFLNEPCQVSTFAYPCHVLGLLNKAIAAQPRGYSGFFYHEWPNNSSDENQGPSNGLK